MAEIQRSRLLAAAVGAIDEFGYDGASVARITARTGVSRRTFYELFDDREDCLLAVLDGAVRSAGEDIAVALSRTGAGKGSVGWRERVRTGLWALLSLFERERALARVCVVESQRAGQSVLKRRQETLDELARIVDEGRGQRKGDSAGGFVTAQAVVGGVTSVLYAHLLDREREGSPLTGLLGELMGMIVLPYLGSAAARHELSRALPDPLPASMGAVDAVGVTPGPFEELARLPMRLTYRTAKVLQEVGEHPGSSNRQIGDRAGVEDQGQISKLLSRLERLGLLTNGADGAPAKGEPNRWCLTPTGAHVASTIGARISDASAAAEHAESAA